MTRAYTGMDLMGILDHRKFNLHVNIGVDIKVLELVDIYCVEASWQLFHRLYALSEANECEVNKTLDAWSRSSRPDCNKIVNSLKMIGENRRLTAPMRVVDLRNAFPDLLELKAPKIHSRIFFFYQALPAETLECAICTSCYWKTRGDSNNHKPQQEAMQKAFKLMLRFREEKGLVH